MHPFKNVFTISSGLSSFPVNFNNSSFMPRGPCTEIVPTPKPTVHHVNYGLSWSVIVFAIQTHALVAAHCDVKIWADCRDSGAGENTLRQQSFNRIPIVASFKFFHCSNEHNATVFHWSKINTVCRKHSQKGRKRGRAWRRGEKHRYINRRYSLYPGLSTFDYSKQYSTSHQ